MNLRSSICAFSVFLLTITGCGADVADDRPEIWDGYSVPQHFKSRLLLEEERINNAVLGADGDYSSLIFFTDAHWEENNKHSPAIINHIIHFTPVSDVVFGGDVITYSFKNPETAISLGRDFRNAFDVLDCNMYYLYGNHDNNSDSQPDDTARHLSDEQVYDYLQKGMGECHYGDYFNFYFDRPEGKTRFICLDTGRFFYYQFRGTITATVGFLTEALNDTPEGWRIILLSHLWCNMDYEHPRKPYFPDYILSMLSVLDDYNAGNSGSFEYGGKSVPYVFSGASSKIIACIGGHCHTDAVLYSDAGIPVILTTTDSRQTVNKEPAETRTINEQAVSVFVFDYKNSSIDMFRIGRGEDLSLPMN